jgi:hypothetical protein
MVAPTRLQLLLEPSVRTELAASGYGEPTVIWSALEAPFYNPGKPVAEGQFIAGDAIVWLHDDGASFTVDGIGDRFERASFITDESMADAFIRRLREVLNR